MILPPIDNETTSARLVGHHMIKFARGAVALALVSCLIGGGLIVVLYVYPVHLVVAYAIRYGTSRYWHLGLPSKDSVSYTHDLIAISIGAGQILAGLFGIYGRHKLGNEFFHAEALNGDWFWATVSMGDSSPNNRVARGTLTISSIHDLTRRQEEPGAVICGKITAIAGEPYVSYPHFEATEIVVGRKSSKRLVFAWRHSDKAGNSMTGINLLNIETDTKKRLKWFLFLRKRPFVETMSGKYYADQDWGAGEMRLYRIEDEATRHFDLNARPSAQGGRP